MAIRAGYSRTAGTRKLSAFRLGALASASSRGRDGPRTSSRKTLRTSTPWASGSTSRGVELLELRDEVDDRVELAGERLAARPG